MQGPNIHICDIGDDHEREKLAENAPLAHVADLPAKGLTHERDTEQERDRDHEAKSAPVPVKKRLFEQHTYAIPNEDCKFP